MTLVCVHVAFSLPEAAVVGSLLRAYGLAPCAVGGRHAAMHWYMILALGGIRFLVPVADESDARTLLVAAGPPPDVALPETTGFWREPVRCMAVLAVVYLATGMLLAPFWRVPAYADED